MVKKDMGLMAAFLVGSCIFTLILCAALFSGLRHGVQQDLLRGDDARGFFLVGIVLVIFISCGISYYGFPQSSLASSQLQGDQLSRIVIVSVLFNIAISVGALAYGLVRLRKPDTSR